MARTLIAATTVPANGGEAAITWTNADAVNGMYFANDGKTVLLIKNGDVATHTATVTSVADPFGRTGDVAMATIAGATNAAGPFPPNLFTQRDGTGQVLVGFDAGTSVTVAALRLSE